MFLDLSNGYGPIDRSFVNKQVSQGSNVQWAWEQQCYLYACITAYVLTVWASLCLLIVGRPSAVRGDGPMFLYMELITSS